jgi:hypothetical protein
MAVCVGFDVRFQIMMVDDQLMPSAASVRGVYAQL